MHKLYKWNPLQNNKLYNLKHTFRVDILYSDWLTKTGWLKYILRTFWQNKDFRITMESTWLLQFFFIPWKYVPIGIHLQRFFSIFTMFSDNASLISSITFRMVLNRSNIVGLVQNSYVRKCQWTTSIPVCWKVTLCDKIYFFKRIHKNPANYETRVYRQ